MTMMRYHRLTRRVLLLGALALFALARVALAAADCDLGFSGCEPLSSVAAAAPDGGNHHGADCATQADTTSGTLAGASFADTLLDAPPAIGSGLTIPLAPPAPHRRDSTLTTRQSALLVTCGRLRR